MIEPGDMVGRSEFEAYMRQVKDMIMACRPMNGASYGVVRTQQGWMLDFKRSGGGGGGTGAIRQFLVLAETYDYLTCVAWNGSTRGESVDVAKPYDLRKTPWHGASVSLTHKRFSLNKTVTTFTTVLSYDYLDVGYRRASIGDTSYEDQSIIPKYIPERSVIYGMALEGGQDFGVGLESKTLVDINADGRSWARFAV